MAPRPRVLTPDRSARHFYGSELRRYRTKADMSLVRLSEVVNYSKSHLARIEAADTVPPPDLSERLDAAFGTDGHFGRLYGLARREAHPDQYRRYMDFEAQARAHAEYAAHVVPGLLQTGAYARAFFGYAPGATPEQVEERVAARLSRQERWRSDSPPHLWAILDEAVIRRPVGGAEVMREQLASLLPIVDTPNTKIQVLPFQHGGHALMEGPLILLKLPDGSSVAYEEGRGTGRLYEDLETVEERQRRYDALRAYALSPSDSAALIKSAMEDYRPCDPPPS